MAETAIPACLSASATMRSCSSVRSMAITGRWAASSVRAMARVVIRPITPDAPRRCRFSGVRRDEPEADFSSMISPLAFSVRGIGTPAADWIRRKRNHGRATKYTHDFIGRNSRMDGLQGAVLNVKLPHLDGWNAKRRALAALDEDRRAADRTHRAHGGVDPAGQVFDGAFVLFGGTRVAQGDRHVRHCAARLRRPLRGR